MLLCFNNHQTFEEFSLYCMVCANPMCSECSTSISFPWKWIFVKNPKLLTHPKLHACKTLIVETERVVLYGNRSNFKSWDISLKHIVDVWNMITFLYLKLSLLKIFWFIFVFIVYYIVVYNVAQENKFWHINSFFNSHSLLYPCSIDTPVIKHLWATSVFLILNLRLM